MHLSVKRPSVCNLVFTDCLGNRAMPLHRHAKRHTSIATSPATGTRASTTKKSSPRPGSAGRTASAITCGRRRACKVEPAGAVPLEIVDRAGAAAPSPRRPARMPAGRRSDHRPRAAAGQRRRDHVAAAGRRSRRRSCTATPRPTRSSSSTRARARCTPCSASCPSSRSTTSSSRAARPTGSSSTRARSPTCWSSRRPATSSFPPRYLNPDGQLRLGAPYCERDLHGPERDARRSTARRTRPCSSRTADG